MTALRYCGGLRLRITIAPNHVYCVWITDDRGAQYRTDVIPPRYADHAVDHPESIDDAARAALAFADIDDRTLDLTRADIDDSGWIITRKREGER